MLTIIKKDGAKYTCRCECGNTKIYFRSTFYKDSVKSCGCLKRNILIKRNKKHGMCGSRIYRIWRGIVSRCNIESATSYQDYGGRGISVCKEWENSFDNFYIWSKKSGYKENLTIERINNDGNYSPENCCWITKSEQVKNKRKRKSIPKRDKHGRFKKSII